MMLICHLQQDPALLPDLLVIQVLLSHKGFFLIMEDSSLYMSFLVAQTAQCSPTATHSMFYKKQPQEGGIIAPFCDTPEEVQSCNGSFLKTHSSKGWGYVPW